MNTTNVKSENIANCTVLSKSLHLAIYFIVYLLALTLCCYLFLFYVKLKFTKRLFSFVLVKNWLLVFSGVLKNNSRLKVYIYKIQQFHYFRIRKE